MAKELFFIIVGSVFVNNFVFQGFGQCPFGVSNKTELPLAWEWLQPLY